jgi:hypothetical protein
MRLVRSNSCVACRLGGAKCPVSVTARATIRWDMRISAKSGRTDRSSIAI